MSGDRFRDSRRPGHISSKPGPGSNPAGVFSPRTGSLIDPSWLDDPADGRTTDTAIELPAALRPSTAEKTRAIVRLVTGINAGQVFTVETEAVVGRGREALVRIEDAGVSRAHTKLSRIPNGKLLVQDLGSTNGTFVAGERITGAEISTGELVQIGPNVTLSYALVDEAEERLSRQLYESSTRDALTGAYNRKYLMQRLASEVAYAVRHKSQLAVLILDLDHFKKVNDTHGHLAGDEVLRTVAAQVGKLIRAEDVFGRYGGEEFIMIVRGIEAKGVRMFGERVRRAVEKLSMTFGEARLTATVSVGIASLDECGDVGTSEGLLLLADERLYEAKQGGRNRVCSGTAPA